MIKTEKQYQVARTRLAEFTEALEDVRNQDIDPALKEIEVNALQSHIEEFTQDLAEYDALKSGNITAISATLDDLSEALIKCRIARRWTQADLANVLDMKEQQIQRYESTDYEAASLDRIVRVFKGLGAQCIFKVSPNGRDYPFLIPDDIAPENLLQAQQHLQESKSVFFV